MPTEETQGNNLPPVTDVQSAAQHIEGLLDLTPRAETARSSASHSDAAAAPQNDTADDTEFAETDDVEADLAQSEDSTSEDDQDQNEPEEESQDEVPIIEPPKSMNAEWQEKFKQLPPDMQQFVADRESEQNKVFTQRMQQVAEQRKANEAEVAQAAQAQNQYAQTLNQLLTLTVPELQQIENVDWMKLAQDDPTEYVRRQGIRDSLRQRVGYMQSQMQQVQNEQQQQLLARHQEHLAHQYEALIEQVPEFKDTSKAKALVDDIGQTMGTFGFTEQEISSVADARIVRVMAELARLKKLESSRKSALAKKAPAQPPRVVQSNAAPTRDDNSKKKIQEQFNRLKRTGDVRDAARLIEHMI